MSLQGALLSLACWVGIPVDLTKFYLEYPCNSSGSASVSHVWWVGIPVDVTAYYFESQL